MEEIQRRQMSEAIPVVCAIIQNNSGDFLISKRLKTSSLPGMWEFPGGKIEAGEERHTALRREIMEELGIEICIDPFFSYHVTTVEFDHGKFELWYYLANCEYQKPKAIQCEEFRFVPIQELDQYNLLPADKSLVYRLKKDFNG